MSELYTFTVDGFPADHFQVHVFTGKEAISEAYAFDLVVTSDASEDEEVERLALGQRAVLSWTVGTTPRAFHGLMRPSSSRRSTRRRRARAGIACASSCGSGC